MKIDPTITAIPLGGKLGGVAVLDTEDYERVASINWWCHVSGDNFSYARGIVNGRKVYMHRFVTGAESGTEVDHLNHNTFDNRKSNLRVGTKSENMRNSRYPNVYWEKARNKWVSRIKRDGVTKFLGRFDVREAAVEAWREAR